MCPRCGVLTVALKGRGCQCAPSGLGLFHCKFSHKSSLVRCPCAFWLSRLADGFGSSEVALPGCRACFLSYVVFCGKCRTSGTFSSVWQAWHYLQVAKTLAKRGSNWDVVLEVTFPGTRGIWWTWTTFWNVLKGSKVSFCEIGSFLM